MTQMKCLAVIVNYRVTQLTIDCLYSLADEIGRVPGLRVAVCENGTGDDSAERLQKAIDDNGWGAWCTLTVVHPNLGFTGGNNVILRPPLQSDDPPQYALLLNADTIVRPNAIKILVDFMDQHPTVGIAGGLLEAPDGKVQESAFHFHSPLSEFDRSLKFGPVSRLIRHVRPPVPNRVGQCDWVAGASMIVRREVFRDVGLLDEGYYTYFDDIDFCFNAAKAGWPTWYVPASRVMHLEGQTTGVTQKNLKRLPPYFLQARRRYFLKNRGPFGAAMTDLARISGVMLWRLLVMLGKKDTAPPHVLRDAIAYSVFVTGFKLKSVENPALSQG